MTPPGVVMQAEIARAPALVTRAGVGHAMLEPAASSTPTDCAAALPTGKAEAPPTSRRRAKRRLARGGTQRAERGYDLGLVVSARSPEATDRQVRSKPRWPAISVSAPRRSHRRLGTRLGHGSTARGCATQRVCTPRGPERLPHRSGRRTAAPSNRKHRLRCRALFPDRCR